MVRLKSADDRTHRELDRDSRLALFVILLIITFTVVYGLERRGNQSTESITLVKFDPFECSVFVTDSEGKREIELAWLKPIDSMSPQVERTQSTWENALQSLIGNRILIDYVPDNTDGLVVKLENGETLQHVLVRKGLADVDESNPGTPSNLIELRDTARENRQGFWEMTVE
jgi:hypothetical protein